MKAANLGVLSLYLILVASCGSGNSDDKHLSYFRETDFTVETLCEAIKNYGEPYTYRVPVGIRTEEGAFRLTQEQGEACAKNPSVYPLLNKDFVLKTRQQKVYVETIFDAHLDLFFPAEKNWDTASLTSYLRNEFSIAWEDPDEYRLYSHYFATPKALGDVFAKNNSIVDIFKTNGPAFWSEMMKPFVADPESQCKWNCSDIKYACSSLYTLFDCTNTWKENDNIAYEHGPLALYHAYCYDEDYKHEYRWAPNHILDSYFLDTYVGKQIVSNLKKRLKDPSSLEIAEINELFDYPTENFVANGRYFGNVYYQIKYRAKNSFGAYGVAYDYQLYNWHSQSVSHVSGANLTKDNTYCNFHLSFENY